MSLSLNHIALPSHDLDLAETFYSKILGLSLMEYKYDEDGIKRSLWYKCKNFILMIEQTHHPIFQNANAVLAFNIDINNRATFTQNLLNAGVQVIKQTDYTLYFRDPSGNILAFSHYKK